MDRGLLEERDRLEAEELPEDDCWSEKIPDEQLACELTSAFWEDPDPQSVGVLTADRIRAYHYSVGRMIRPFQEKHLNPASYDLTLGPRCVLDGEEVVFDAKRRTLRIPPGSIALVTSRELLLVPHWLVATFNLKSKYIYKGLLMGAGPQIDPGFMGVLTCPLHNISNGEVTLEFCEPFAKLDFVKTTWSANVDLAKVRSESELYQREHEGRLQTHKPRERVKLWPREKNFRPPVSHLVDSKGSQSSLHRLEGDVKGVKSRLNWSILGLGTAAVTALGLIATLVAVSFDYTDGRVEDVRNDNAAAVRIEVKHLLRQRFPSKATSVGQTNASP